MRKQFVLILAVVLLLSACGRTPTPAQPTATIPPLTIEDVLTAMPTFTPFPPATPVPATPTPEFTATPEPTPTPSYPPEGYGPSNFPVDVNPLTGLPVSDPELLNRRPVVIKVENIPREHRPQWGLSLADVVYEYYTEFGATRFAAVFYGNNAERVGPIRSARFFDTHIIQAYKAVFVYGSAYPAVQQRLFNSNYFSRLILETNVSCPALCRFEPNGQNLLVSNTVAMNDYLKVRSVDNTRQNLDGLFFQRQAPEGGEDASSIFIRYSGAIYNRWDYDPESGRYLRFADTKNDINRDSEAYAQLTDRLTGQPIAVENMITVCVPHSYFVKRADSEVLEIHMDAKTTPYIGCDGQSYMGGTGAAFIARDGKLYKVNWQRSGSDQLLTLVNPDGTLFPFKPGQTWFEIVGASSSVQQQPEGAWRFVHVMAP